MPTARRQRILGWAAFVGVLATCSGCGLLWQNQVNAAIIALIIADIIIFPTFAILLTTRRRMKKVVRQKEAEQLDALAGVGDVMAGAEENKGTNSTK